MRDLDKALADILAIRSQLAAGTAFRGYGPATIAVTGSVALLTAALQWQWLPDPTTQPLTFFASWAIAAALSAILIWIVHVYAAIWVKGSVRAMTQGYVTPGWAWRHHRKWLRRLAAGLPCIASGVAATAVAIRADRLEAVLTSAGEFRVGI